MSRDSSGGPLGDATIRPVLEVTMNRTRDHAPSRLLLGLSLACMILAGGFGCSRTTSFAVRVVDVHGHPMTTAGVKLSEKDLSKLGKLRKLVAVQADAKDPSVFTVVVPKQLCGDSITVVATVPDSVEAYSPTRNPVDPEQCPKKRPCNVLVKKTPEI